MADLLGDGNVKVTVVTTLSSKSTPTAAQLNAGIDIQEYVTKEGLDIKVDQAAVDNTALASRSETEDAGTTKHEVVLTYKKQDTPLGDVAFNALPPRELRWIAVRRDRAHETAWAAGQPAEIFPVRCGDYMRQAPKLNEPQLIEQKMFVYEAADTEAVVA
ncbi:phage tail tube protein [Actinomadura rudentiformis]|uniref:Uncharacterized protein n=1 Tax=Actinomadura rudentiformis TaxID=359158 RepID=A0A6H9YZ98_9ACTN|nr:hypothetical protein [Actinomadura rudentiformis]KAB2347353.1 hypothetical protein F8566_20285 [Actinomadura rudentiformis]